jgi:hypothetical protein
MKKGVDGEDRLVGFFLLLFLSSSAESFPWMAQLKQQNVLVTSEPG